jgi:hypothetical protein
MKPWDALLMGRSGSQPFGPDFTAVMRRLQMSLRRPVLTGRIGCPLHVPQDLVEKNVAEPSLSEWSFSELSLGGKTLMKKTWDGSATPPCCIGSILIES